MTKHHWITRLLFSAFLTLWGSPAAVRACTIFVLTDGEQTLFCNNEDWSDPNTRIWFVPPGEGFLGAGYVGFDNGWAQGGVNTEGLAYDWVAGFKEKWERDRSLKSVRGNSSQRMLETCRTVEEAIDFYRNHWEAEFSRARILVADRTGASVIIGARDGKLLVEKASHCRGFGYARETVEKRLATPPKPSPANGMEILTACRQRGEFATKYSNIFDLRNGTIHLREFQEENEVTLNLAEELKKGPHFYELSRLRAQAGQAPRPLPPNMRRFPMDGIKPGHDKQPEITALVASRIRDAASGKMRAEHYSPELWEELSGNQAQIEKDLHAFGDFVGLSFVENRGDRTVCYRVDFSKATVLQSFTLTEAKIITASESEMMEWKVEQP
jgi:predicted choloylglycine hydrolase